MTWSNFLTAFSNLRDKVFPFAQDILDIFNTPVRELISYAPAFVEDILELLPNAILDSTLLVAMTGALLPVILVVFVVKVII